MAVNQAQVDHIISSASADDPEVKLLKLQDEVELIKTSIKRLLIDIRERMNDLENPFIATAPGGGVSGAMDTANVLKTASSAVESAADALKTSAEINKKGKDTAVSEPGDDEEEGPDDSRSVAGPANEKGRRGKKSAVETSESGQEILQAIRAQMAGGGFPGTEETKKADEAQAKIRLRKVFRLFEWTSKNVKRFGQDRVDLMLSAYSMLGYISEANGTLVKEITRMMPGSLGELHEIKADDFVTELYELNHILDPSDTTLDRDMIEVLMERKEGRVIPRTETVESRGAAESSGKDFLSTDDRV